MVGSHLAPATRSGALASWTQPMNEKAPMPETESNTGEPKVKRPYVAPALVVFGNVEEFTRGSGAASPLDGGGRTTRKVR